MWADLAQKLGRDVYEISRGLAHSGLGITERYLAKIGGDVVDGELRATVRPRWRNLFAQRG